MKNFRYLQNQSTIDEIHTHLMACSFLPPLETYVNVKKYSKKIFLHAKRFECWNDDSILVGLVAMYLSDRDKPFGYITNVSVIPAYNGIGVARKLLANAILYALQCELEYIGLEVFKSNSAATQLYDKMGFKEFECDTEKAKMRLIPSYKLVKEKLTTHCER